MRPAQASSPISGSSSSGGESSSHTLIEATPLQPPAEPATPLPTAAEAMTLMTSSSFSSSIWGTRHRNVTVLFLSAISMIGCVLWWGRLPVGLPTKSNSSSSMLRLKYGQDATPPPLLFQSAADDDENEFTGDDDGYKKEQGEQGRDSNGNSAAGTMDSNSKKKKPSTATASVSASSTPESSTSSSLVSPQPTTSSWESKKRPKIVWLMSYPNSGTSYTMTMVGRASNHATASNYGREVTDPPTTNVPLYPNQWDGPFYRPNPQKPLPSDYVLVKTHCGGRCVPCGPDNYLLNETSFLDECRRGAGLFAEGHRQMEESNDDTLPDGFQLVHYNASLVKKAIHLIRNPFHNIVSRFHLERKHWATKGKQREVERYANDAKGFHVWCQDLNNQYGPSLDYKSPSALSKESHVTIPHDVVELMQDVPCHGEIYKYVQWHNHANAVMTKYLKRPTMIVHYENYDKAWNVTATKILDFLHLEMEGTKKEFHARDDYGLYFTSSQQKSAEKLIRRLARPNVWELLERYFV